MLSTRRPPPSGAARPPLVCTLWGQLVDLRFSSWHGCSDVVLLGPNRTTPSEGDRVDVGSLQGTRGRR